MPLHNEKAGLGKILTMTASVFIINNVLKNILKPAYVKRKFLLVKLTIWLYCWNKFLKFNLKGVFT